MSIVPEVQKQNNTSRANLDKALSPANIMDVDRKRVNSFVLRKYCKKTLPYHIFSFFCKSNNVPLIVCKPSIDLKLYKICC